MEAPNQWEFCKQKFDELEKKIDAMQKQVLELTTSNQTLVRYIVVGLLAIVGAVVGVKVLPA